MGLDPPDGTGRDSLAALVNRGAAMLRAAGIDNPRREARLLLAHALGVTMEVLLRHRDIAADPAHYNELVRRRAAREPLAFILGRREFWGMSFAVSPATLIPRPDSETLIEAALAAFAGGAGPNRILDLGTGTGCLLLAALSEFPGAFGVGVDRSYAAAQLARANAAALHLGGRAMFLCADWAAALHARFELVLCNPPYVTTLEVGALMPEVACFEPASALNGGMDGLAAYRQLIPAMPDLLEPNGSAVLELGIGQAPAVAAMARDAGMVAVTRPDLGGTPRAMVLRRAIA